MDINDLRGILTAIALFAFIGLWVFVWNRRRKTDYDASARLPLEEDRYVTNSDIDHNYTNDNSRENT